MHKITWTHGDDEGNEIITEFPAHWEICDVCSGEGKHSLAIGAITSTEWNEDWDEEDREHYLNGAYDRQCENCKNGKLLVINEEEAEATMSAEYASFLEYQHERAYSEAISRAERRMGA